MPAPMIGSDNTSVMKFNSPDQKLLHPIAAEEEEEEDEEEPRLFVLEKKKPPLPKKKNLQILLQNYCFFCVLKLFLFLSFFTAHVSFSPQTLPLQKLHYKRELFVSR
jgi:hypothetical protein